jgi:L-malate glycosyltransferase
MEMNLNILHTVESYLPSVGGMAEVARQLSERIVASGHNVTVATGRVPGRSTIDMRGVHIAEFDVSGNMVTGMRGDLDSYRRFVLDSKFDIVTNFAAQQWATDALYDILPRVHGKKVFVPTGFSGLTSSVYRGYFTSMSSWMQQYDMTVLTGHEYRDAVFARERNIDRTMVIPNGAAADEFDQIPCCDIRAKFEIPSTDFLILHVGSHTGLKGHPELLRIFAQAAINNTTLLIVGSRDEGCYRACEQQAAALNRSRKFVSSGKRIILASLTRGETIAAFITSDLFLFPSAIECSPIVLFECMASHTPFLVTDVGNAREIIAWSGGGELLRTVRNRELEGNRARTWGWLSAATRTLNMPSPECSPLAGLVMADVRASARLLEDIYRDASRRAKFAFSGYASWRKRFTWEKISSEYEALYQRLVEGTE